MTEKNKVKNKPLVIYKGIGRASEALIVEEEECFVICDLRLGSPAAVTVLVTGRRRTSIIL